MTDLLKEFDFVLSNPVEYMKSGEIVKTKSLILKSPSVNNMRLLSKLKQGFFRAIKSLQNANIENQSKKQQKEAKISGDEIVAMLYMSEIDMVEYLETFKELMINGICFVDESQKITSQIYNELSYDDSEKLLGKYLENFMISSWLDMTKMK